MLTELLLAADLMESVHSGNKKLTIRKGRRDIAVGEELLIENVDDSSDYAHVIPLLVMYTTFRHCPIEYVANDGFSGREDAVHLMRRFYPDMHMDTEITVVCW